MSPSHRIADRHNAHYFDGAVAPKSGQSVRKMQVLIGLPLILVMALIPSSLDPSAMTDIMGDPFADAEEVITETTDPEPHGRKDHDNPPVDEPPWPLMLTT